MQESGRFLKNCKYQAVEDKRNMWWKINNQLLLLLCAKNQMKTTLENLIHIYRIYYWTNNKYN